VIADAGWGGCQSSDATDRLRTENLIQLNHGLHLVAGQEELRFGMSCENSQFDGVEQRSTLLCTGRCPALVLGELHALVTHLCNCLQRSVKIFLPVGYHGVYEQADGNVLGVLRIRRVWRSRSKREEASA